MKKNTNPRYQRKVGTIVQSIQQESQEIQVGMLLDILMNIGMSHLPDNSAVRQMGLIGHMTAGCALCMNLIEILEKDLKAYKDKQMN